MGISKKACFCIGACVGSFCMYLKNGGWGKIKQFFNYGDDNDADVIDFYDVKHFNKEDDNDDSLDSTNTWRTTDRIGSTLDNVRLSNIIHKERYSETICDEASKDEASSVPIQLVNDISTESRDEKTIDPVAVIGETVIPPDVVVRRDDDERKKFIIISPNEYLRQEAHGNQVMEFIFNYDKMAFFEVSNDTEFDENLMYDQRQIAHLIGYNLANDIFDDAINQNWFETEYVYNVEKDLYICLRGSESDSEG